MAEYQSAREQELRAEMARQNPNSIGWRALNAELNKVLANTAGTKSAVEDYSKGGPAKGILEVGGSEKERVGAAVGLNRGQLLYGQNMAETGQDIQGVKSGLKSRVEGSDPVTEAIKQQAGQSRASTARQFAGRGVAGGVAASGIEQSARQKDIDIAASLYGQNRQNLKDYGNLVGNIAGQQGALEMSYMGMGTASDQPNPPSYGGGLMGGTVICTELHRQGYFSDETLEKEKAYGLWLIENDPEVYLGYRMWADSVVKVMQKSELFSFVVACVATPWASYVAGNCNLVGMTINAIGAPMCKLVYKLFGRKYGLSNQ